MPARRRSFTRSQRRPTNWSGSVAAAATVLTPLSKVLALTLVPEGFGGETVIRIRGTLLVSGDATDAGFVYNGAIGAIIVTETAVTAGIASLPDPVSDADDDGWMFYRSFAGIPSGDGAAGALGAQLLELDVKAERRMPDGHRLVFVVANASTAIGFKFVLLLRALSSEMS